MNNIYFKFKNHPGDFLRNTDVNELPNPQNDLENFLVQFLRSYQSDERVTYLDDLYKLLDDEFFNEEDKNKIIQISSCKTEQEIKNKIQQVENELKNEAFNNFYNLVQTKQIEIIENGEK
jgi:hypothetical protein